MRHAVRSLVSLVAASALLSSCSIENDEPLTREEAEEAVDASTLSSSAQALTYDIVEISTHFTLGDAARAAALKLRAFAASQIPCSSVTAEEHVVTIDFGDLSDGCTFRGHRYAGTAIIEIERSEGEAQVHHTWQGLTNGKVTVDGEADVTWSRAESSRHVRYAMDFTSSDHPGHALHATGDVTQTLIDPAAGFDSGIEIDGSREWSLDDGRTWVLEIEGVEVRRQDPVPQAGSYTLTTPEDKTLSLAFERISDTVIRVTATGARGRVFHVDVRSLR